MDRYQNLNNENNNPARDTGDGPEWRACRTRPVLGELRPSQYQSNDGRPPRRRISLDQIFRRLFGTSFEERAIRTGTLRVTLDINEQGVWGIVDVERPQERAVEQEISEEMENQNRLNEDIERDLQENAQRQPLGESNQQDNQEEPQGLQDVLPDNHDELPDHPDTQLNNDNQEN
ncbi:unnamed protein product [Caenorhabditis brenneri]